MLQLNPGPTDVSPSFAIGTDFDPCVHYNWVQFNSDYIFKHL